MSIPSNHSPTGYDPIDEAGAEPFPTSDPPTWGSALAVPSSVNVIDIGAQAIDHDFPEIEVEDSVATPHLPKRGMVVVRRVAYAVILAAVVMLVRRLRRAHR